MELPLENFSTASALGSDNLTAKYYSKKKDKAEQKLKMKLAKLNAQKNKQFWDQIVEPGSVSASVFALIIISMGAGTITIPFIYYENGIVFGSLLILFGGSLSLFTGFLIAYAAEVTGGHNYEEIAFKIYG